MSKGSCLQTWTTITLFSREKTKHYQSKQSYVPRSAGAAACSKPHVTAPSSPRARTLLNPQPLFWAGLQVNAWRHWMLLPMKPRLANLTAYVLIHARGRTYPSWACLWAEAPHHPWKVTPGAHLAILYLAPQPRKDHSLPHTDLLLPLDLENMKFFLDHINYTPLRGGFAGQISTEM